MLLSVGAWIMLYLVPRFHVSASFLVASGVFTHGNKTAGTLMLYPLGLQALDQGALPKVNLLAKRVF
jgi:hypothetical protein